MILQKESKEKFKDNIYLSNLKNYSLKGKIKFKDFSIKYREESSIKKLKFNNKSNEKIGIKNNKWKNYNYIMFIQNIK